VTLGAYINYYRDGNDWAPSHSHPKQVQMIISLGTTRNLIVGTKTYILNSGDMIIFGSSTHQVHVEPEVTEGRISIATFMVPKNSNTTGVVLNEDIMAALFEILNLDREG
jgi:hypothetical protein